VITSVKLVCPASLGTTTVVARLASTVPENRIGCDAEGEPWLAAAAAESPGAAARHDTSDRPASPRIETIVLAAGRRENTVLTLRRITV
jgi:hypothetical protein